MTTEALRYLTPELVLITLAMLIYTAGLFCDLRAGWKWIGAGGLAAGAAVMWSQTMGPPAGAIIGDALACYTRWLALGVGMLLVTLICHAGARGTSRHVGSLLLAVAALMVTAGAGDLVVLFVSLEMISIPIYILLRLGRKGAATDSEEATAKYFFLGALASTMLLFGFGFLYGMAGSTNLGTVAAALSDPAGFSTSFAGFAKPALVLIFAGLGFKIAAVPFHFYAPDVFEGTTHGNAALISVIPKVAGLVAMVRLLGPAMAGAEPHVWRIILLTAILTMTVGNVLALWQDNLRRLLAYATIAQTGYMLMGLAAGPAIGGTAGAFDGIRAMLFYLSTYAIAVIGTFAAMEYLGRRQQSIDNVEQLAGLARTRPVMAAVIAVLMFSLTGIPPLAGFWGKLFIFGSALDADAGLRPWFVALAIVGALGAAVTAAYCLRIVAVMYFRVPLATPKAEGGTGPLLAAMASAVMVILIGILPGALLGQSTGVFGHKREDGAIEHCEGARYSLGRSMKPLARPLRL